MEHGGRSFFLVETVKNDGVFPLDPGVPCPFPGAGVRDGLEGEAFPGVHAHPFVPEGDFLRRLARFQSAAVQFEEMKQGFLAALEPGGRFHIFAGAFRRFDGQDGAAAAIEEANLLRCNVIHPKFRKPIVSVKSRDVSA